MTIRRYLVVGNRPPPMTGAGIVTAAVVDTLDQAGVELVTIDAVSPGRLPAKIMVRAAAVLRAWWHLRDCSTVYLQANTGWGRLQDLLVIGAARLRPKVRVIYHHHSFSYLDRVSRLSSILARVGGTQVEHWLLCQRMLRLYQQHYGARTVAEVVDNACFIPDRVSRSRNREDEWQPRFLILGTLSVEKGLDRAVEVLRGVAATSDLTPTLTTVGPFKPPELRSFLAQEMTRTGVAWSHYGECPRAEALAHLDDVDYLLQLSSQEAMPLTVLEAAAAGVVPIVSDVGCVSEWARSTTEAIVVPADPAVMAASAVDAIIAHRANPRTPLGGGLDPSDTEGLVNRLLEATR